MLEDTEEADVLRTGCDVLLSGRLNLWYFPDFVHPVCAWECPTKARDERGSGGRSLRM